MEKLRSLSSVLDEIAEQFVDGIVSEKVGEPTGKKTTAGRSKIKTPKGETVSEKSVTLKLGDKYYNLPSIYSNKRYSDDVLRKALQDGVIQPTSVHDSNEQAKEAAIKRSKGLDQGGAVMQEQMNMAFMQEGGMQDDGGETEPTSGNKVPSGSLKEEVADDIPTMLSEGEFVFPADVVRYIGLETLMKMRQDAKQGLKMMEKMGQLGNPDEAEIPDDVPFGMADLVVISGEMKKEDDEKEEKAEGGVVGLQEGGMPPKRPDSEFYESDAYKMYQDEKDVAYPQVMTEASDGTMLGNPGLARAYDEYLKTKKSAPPTDTGGGSLLDDPRFKRDDSQSSTEYTEEEKQQLKDALKTAPTRGDVTLKKIVNPDNPDDFEMHPYEGDEPMFPLPEGYVLDDTPVEDLYGAKPRGGGDTGDSGGSDDRGETGIFDPNAAFKKHQEAIDKLRDIPESIDTDILSRQAGAGNKYTLTKDGRPIRLQKETFDSLVRDYEALQEIEGVDKMSFADYYNLPTFDKVKFALETNLGMKPTAEQVNNAIAKAKGSKSGILSPFMAGLKGIIGSLSPDADKSPVDAGFVAEREKRLASLTNINSLLEGNSPYEVNAQGALTSKGYDQYLKDRFSVSGAKFDDDPTKGTFSNFLSGTRRNKNDGTIEIFSKGKFVPLTAQILKGLEENRQKTTTGRLTTESLLAKDPFAKATVKKDPTGGMIKTKGTEPSAFIPPKKPDAVEKKEQTKPVVVDETPPSDITASDYSGPTTGSDNNDGGGSQDQSQDQSNVIGSGYYQAPTPSYVSQTAKAAGSAKTGLGASASRPQTFGVPTYTAPPTYSYDQVGPYYVGGVATKPMKPQRLKKGGMALPKAKPKKMKKGGLASSRKK